MIAYGEQHDMCAAQKFLSSLMEAVNKQDGEERFELY